METPSRLAQLKGMVERDPKSRLFVQLADEYRRAGQPGEAIAVLRRGLEHHPSYVGAWTSLGKLYVESGRDPDARPCFERVLGLDPQNVVSARLLGDLHHRNGQLVEAVKRYKLVRAITPDRDVEELIGAIEARINEGPPMSVPSAAPATSSEDVEPPDPAVSLRRDPQAGEAAEAAGPVSFPGPEGAQPGADEPMEPGPTAVPGPAELESEEPQEHGDVVAAEGSAIAAAELREASEEDPFETDASPAALQSSGVPREEWGSPETADGLDSSDIWREVESKGPNARGAAESGGEGEARGETDARGEATSSPQAPSADRETEETTSVEATTLDGAEAGPGGFAAPDATPTVGPPAAVAEDGEESGTLTLAELYLEQGHPEEALRILVQLDRAEPGNPVYQVRLAEVERLLGSSSERSRSAEADSGATSAEPPSEDRRVQVVRVLERWLDMIRAGT